MALNLQGASLQIRGRSEGLQLGLHTWGSPSSPSRAGPHTLALAEDAPPLEKLCKQRACISFGDSIWAVREGPLRCTRVSVSGPKVLAREAGNSVQRRMGFFWGESEREDRCRVSMWLCEFCLLRTVKLSEPLKTPIKLTSALRNRKTIFFFYAIYCSDLPTRPGKRHPLRRRLALGLLVAFGQV